MTCNSIYSPLKVNELELYIQDLIKSTIHPISKRKINKIRDSLLYIGQVYGHLDWFYMSEKECIKFFGQRKDLTDVHKKLIHICIRRIHKGNNLDNKGCSQYYITDELKEFVQYNLQRQEYKMNGLIQKGDVNIQFQTSKETYNNAVDICKLKQGISIECSNRNLSSLNKLSKFGKENDLEIIFNIPNHNGAEGRLHSIFTNMSKELRHILFNGWYDYDIEASMPTIIAQAAQAHYLFDTPQIQKYIDNKDEIRQKIAIKLNISLSKIKQLYNMPFFGAKFPSPAQALSTFVNNKSRAMTDLVGVNNILLLNQDSEWCSYIDEINQIKKLFNKFNIWDLYFKIERLILDEILTRTGFINIIPIHDGFMSLTIIDSKELEEVIKQKTGIEIKIEEKQIKKRELY